METKKLKVLTYSGNFINVNLLDKGIYNSNKPFIYDENETIIGLIERGRSMKDLTGACFLSDSYFENISKCELTDYELKLFLPKDNNDVEDELRYKVESDKSIIYDSKTDKNICMYFNDETKDLLLNVLNKQ